MFLDGFIDEAKTHIERIETAFLNTDTLISTPKLMNSVFRAAHSIKGTAGFFSLRKIVAVSHELESVFSQIRDGELKIDEKIVDITLQSVDCLKELIVNIKDDSFVDVFQVINTLKKISGADQDLLIPFDLKNNDTEKKLKEAIQYGHKVYYIAITINKNNPESVKEITDIINKTGAVIEEKLDASSLSLLVTSVLDLNLFSIAVNIDKKNIHHLHNDTFFIFEETSDKHDNLPVFTDNGRTGKRTKENENSIYIRLDISILNDLMDFANEMILTRNQLFSTLAGHTKSISGLAHILYDVNRLTSEVQEKIMSMRMQPISVIFAKFPRIIRDTAKALGKDINVEILRDDVYLDKYLLEALTDPITQIVKNSASHGLETSETRVSLGKPPKGRICLTAYMRDGSAVVEIIDDGAGINTSAIKQKALDLGLTTEDAASQMSENEVYDLLFEPGISTSSQITDLSGRGFGMDIVKTNIEKLGGYIEIESQNGLGTTIRLVMPITLSVIKTLIVNIDSIQYAVPELNIERIVRINKENTTRRIEKVNKSLVLVLNGRIIPIVTIKEIEAKVKDLESISANALWDHYQHAGIVKCLILKTKGKTFALLIDEALDAEQILVKPLPVYLHSCRCYSNVTVLGNGKAATVIDAEGIMQYMGLDDVEKEAIKTLSLADEAVITEQTESEKKQIVVFKCSGPEYFAVNIEDVQRIENINAGDIQKIGPEHYVNVNDKTIRILKPEDYSPVTKKDYTKEKLFILTLKNSASLTGLLARKIIDKIEDTFTLDTEQLHSDYIRGTSVFNEKILIFLNPDVITSAKQLSVSNAGKNKKAGVL